MASVTTSKTMLSSTDIRHKFSIEMSQVYRNEVPLYADLISLVASVNDDFLATRPQLRQSMKLTKQLDRLHYERHGAIRLGTSEEMALMARFLGIMGMQPVGYYDLTQPPARLPIHATCFRCLDLESLSVNPFRVFVSLLRPEHISNDSLREKAFDILSRRQIFSRRCLELISTAEQQRGALDAEQADEFIREGLETFKWRGTATVSLAEYEELQQENPLLADIVAFPGPHINHLTPRTLDIDQVQLRMEKQGIPVKEVIEGPPARQCPILLRQTSFKALKEGVYFPLKISSADDETTTKSSNTEVVPGNHTARFGEIEQRGAALTKKGRALYDHLVAEAWKRGVTPQDPEAFKDIFQSFPDTWEELRVCGLAWFRYHIRDGEDGRLYDNAKESTTTVESLIQQGRIVYEPMTYEDFLPLSAAGIFRSNLRSTPTDSDEGASYEDQGKVGKEALQKALRLPIVDEIETYEKLQEASLDLCRKHFGIKGSQTG